MYGWSSLINNVVFLLNTLCPIYIEKRSRLFNIVLDLNLIYIFLGPKIYFVLCLRIHFLIFI